MQVPTTLMAAVDASVGIKTAVNFQDKKNKLGTYCPPLAVFLDRCLHQQLPAASLACLAHLRMVLGHDAAMHADSHEELSPDGAAALPRSFLRSLDQRNISNGAAEMLKMACIKDEELFQLLEEHAEDMMVSKFQVRRTASSCMRCNTRVTGATARQCVRQHDSEACMYGSA